MGDEELLARAEEALTQIKVNQGLSEDHEAVLAALRIRLKGSAGRSLEEMLEAADDPGPDLAERLGEAERTPERSLADLRSGHPAGSPPASRRSPTAPIGPRRAEGLPPRQPADPAARMRRGRPVVEARDRRPVVRVPR